MVQRILVIGNYGAGNRGDELILSGLLHVLHELKVSPIVVSQNPSETRALHSVMSCSRLPFGIRSFFRFGYLRTLVEYFRCHSVIIGGGGLFVDRFALAPLLWGMHGLLALVLFKPLFLLGHSFELRKCSSRWLFTFLARRATYITVRDRASLDFLHSIGISPSRCSLVADLSFCHSSGERSSKRKVVAVSVCQWGMNEERMDSLCSFLSHVLADGYEEVRLFPFQVGRDDDTVEALRVASRLDSDRVRVVSYDDPEFDSLFTECSLLVGMRLHSILTAFASRMQVMGIAYQDKIVHSMEDLSLGDYCIRIDALSESGLTSCYERLDQQKLLSDNDGRIVGIEMFKKDLASYFERL